MHWKPRALDTDDLLNILRRKKENYLGKPLMQSAFGFLMRIWMKMKSHELFQYFKNISNTFKKRHYNSTITFLH